MVKAGGAVLGVFFIGGVSMAMLQGVLGASAEFVSLGLVGLGLFATSQWVALRGRSLGAVVKPLTKEAHA